MSGRAVHLHEFKAVGSNYLACGKINRRRKPRPFVETDNPWLVTCKSCLVSTRWRLAVGDRAVGALVEAINEQPRGRPMTLPKLFRQMHGDKIFRLWVRDGQPHLVCLIPAEPLGSVTPCPDDGAIPELTVSLFTARCWNDRGTMRFEAATPADLKVAEQWTERHKETPPDAFKWFPDVQTIVR